MAIDDKKKPLLTSALDFEGVDGYGGEVDDWFESDLPLSSISQKPNTPATPSAPANPAPPINGKTEPIQNPVEKAFVAAALAREQARQAAAARDPISAPIPTPAAPQAKVNATPKSAMVAVKEITKSKSTSATAKPKEKKPEQKPALLEEPAAPSKLRLWLANENFSVYVGVTLILALLLSFWISYAYVQKKQLNKSGLSYVTLPAQAFSLKGKNFRVRVTIQALEKDKEWLQENKKNLDSAFTLGFTKLDPNAMSSPDEMLVVQKTLAAEMNKIIPGEHIQAVLLSELLVQNTDQ
jgi:hypothetical protein